MDTETKAALWGAIVGGIIAGFFSWLATHQTLKAERILKNEEHERDINSLLFALEHELTVVWSHYLLSVEHRIDDLKEDGMFLYVYASTGNRYIIYEASASRIGIIPQKELQNAIIDAYTKIKSLNDDFVFNNQFLAEPNKNEGHLKATARLIKKDHQIAKDAVDKLIMLLAATLKS